MSSPIIPGMVEIRLIRDISEIAPVAKDPRVLRWTIGDADIAMLPADWLERSESIRYGAFDEEGLILYIAFHPLSAATWICHAVVNPTQWGKGFHPIGIAVLEFVARTHQVRAFLGAVPSNNRLALQAMRQCGFEVAMTLSGGCRHCDLIISKKEM